MAAPARGSGVREHNLGLVLSTLARAPHSSRAELAAETGLTKATVSALVEVLLAGGLVTELPSVRNAVGRPSNPLELNADGPVAVGIEVNVDYIAVAVVDLKGDVRAHRAVPYATRTRSPQVVLGKAVGLVREIWPQVASRPVLGVCVAAPGLVEDGAIVRVAPNLARWRDVRVVDIVHRAWGAGVPVAVINEANAAALGELWNGGRGLTNFVHVSGEVGIGGGIVIDSVLFEGARGFAGELGHLTVDRQGPRCACGSAGCVEQYAGLEVLLRKAKIPAELTTRTASPGGPVTELVQRASAGRVDAVRALADAGAALGVALAGVVNVLDVGAVVLGGIYAPLAPWLVEPVSSSLTERVLSSRYAPVSVHVSTLGTQAAVQGAGGWWVHRALMTPANFLSA